MRATSLLASAAAALLLASRESINGTGNAVFEATLEPHYYGQQYTINITVAGEVMPVIPDTGSFSLLVTSKRCAVCPQQAFDHVDAEARGAYDPNEEDAVVERVSFGSGAVKVRLSFADVELGSSEARTALWEITHSDSSMNEVWRGASFEGIFGLGWKKEDRNETTVLEALDINEFAFCMGRSPKAQGTLHFGTSLPDRRQGYADVVGENHWGVSLSKLTVARDGAQTLCTDSKCGALVDSGTSQLLLPPEHVVAFKDMIGHVDPHCSNYEQLPDLVFELGGHEVRLTREAYSRRLVMGGIPKVRADGPRLIFEKTEAKEYCWLTIGSAILMSDHGPVWIFGMPFFREHLVSFDRANKRIGIGEPCGPPKLPAEESHAAELCKTGDLVDEDGNAVPCSDVEAHALVRAEKGGRPVMVRSPGLQEVHL